MNLKATTTICRDSARNESQSKSHCDLDLLDIVINTSKLSLKERSNTAETEETYASSFESPRNFERLTINIVSSINDDDEFIWYADTPSSCGTMEGDYNARQRLLFFPDESFDFDEGNQPHDPVGTDVLQQLSHAAAAAARFESSFHRVPTPITEDGSVKIPFEIAYPATTIDE
jgi:hypothetical protein